MTAKAKSKTPATDAAATDGADNTEVNVATDGSGAPKSPGSGEVPGTGAAKPKAPTTLIQEVEAAAAKAMKEGDHAGHATLVGLGNALSTVHNFVNGMGKQAEGNAKKLVDKAAGLLEL